MARRHMAGGLLAVAMMGLAAYFGARVAVRTADAKPEPKAKPMPPMRAAFVAMADVMAGSKKFQRESKRMVDKRQEATKKLLTQRELIAELERKASRTADRAEQEKLVREMIDGRRKWEDDDRRLKVGLDAEVTGVLKELRAELTREIEAMARERQLDVVYGYPMYIEKALAQNGDNPILVQQYIRPEGVTPLYLRAELDLTRDLIERLNKIADADAEKDDDQ